MLSLDNLAKRTANIPVAPSLNLDLLKISLAKLRKATNNFDAKLLVGEGEFGKVYKGTLQGIEVAVKRSRLEDRQSFMQFETEIKVISKFRHRHLLQFDWLCPWFLRSGRLDERNRAFLLHLLDRRGWAYCLRLCKRPRTAFLGNSEQGQQKAACSRLRNPVDCSRPGCL